MNGSTRACVTILNVFGLFALIIGVIAVVLTATASNGFSMGTILQAVPGLASIVSGALLIGASEGLRLLSEIRESLRARPTVSQPTRRAA
jgi:hypothetical protein